MQLHADLRLISNRERNHGSNNLRLWLLSFEFFIAFYYYDTSLKVSQSTTKNVLFKRADVIENLYRLIGSFSKLSDKLNLNCS